MLAALCVCTKGYSIDTSHASLMPQAPQQECGALYRWMRYKRPLAVHHGPKHAMYTAKSVGTPRSCAGTAHHGGNPSQLHACPHDLTSTQAQTPAHRPTHTQYVMWQACFLCVNTQNLCNAHRQPSGLQNPHMPLSEGVKEGWVTLLCTCLVYKPARWRSPAVASVHIFSAKMPTKWDMSTTLDNPSSLMGRKAPLLSARV
jgi:hypothetical protein